MDQLANSIAENIPVLIGLGKVYLVIVFICVVIIVAVSISALFGFGVYHQNVDTRKNIQPKRRSREEFEEDWKRYEAEKKIKTANGSKENHLS